MPIEFDDATRQRILTSLERFAKEHLDAEIGLLQSELLFDFVLKLIGPSVYNQAVSDAGAYLQGKLLDLESDLHQTVEFGV
ncbi:MAG: DUF2164 domain-containing protein [Phycisphaerales bacterium]|nr:DUF2164 domain-containing protein [Phycisphaerae bacterium]NNF43481.1 DUF2164 domain-containing protein [Phycisphaerales bacterium]NNM26896.1 DUF2164 domain-containing protein [Phycisphaerales bacterium]